MSEPMKIGNSVLSGNGYVKKEYFGLKPNENNLFRVLPPLFSLADKGQYAKYYATHKIWLQDAPAAGSTERGKSHIYQFHCLEKTDQKTKLIIFHCPFCDTQRKNQAVYDDAKNKGAGKEQLQEFRDKHVAPFEKEKKFYVNAVSLENKVGMLPLGIKAFKALQERLLDIQKNYGGMDATGVNGLFLNFKKTQKFKGDRDTVYTVDAATDTTLVNGMPQLQLKPHTLTTDFIETMRTQARDLGALFTSITSEEMGHILQSMSSSIADRVALLDKIFQRGQKTNMTTGHNVGSTGVEVVSRIEMKNGDVKVLSPDPFQSAPAVNLAAIPAQEKVLVATTAQAVTLTPAPIAAPVAAAQITMATAPVAAQPAFPVNPMQPTVAVGNSNQISDDEFVRLFGGNT